VRHYFTPGADELYHLSDDPGETRNFFNDPRHERTQAGLQKKLLRWQRAIDDPILRRLEPK